MTEKVSIQAIDKTSVHRICSGQVILNLATAVKELVENSLDAGATSVEVRIKEHGKESIEVVDNGRGVEEDNYPGLALKHHTSKLREFVDLTVVDTFGFRGEALSSLCALGKVTITTRHGNATTGHRIDFNHLGTIVKKIPCPRQPGTSVLIHSLFSTLPVRHKEFIRNVKKEFAKMVQVLTAYCLVSTGVKLQCYHISDTGKKSMVLNTNCNASVRDNITNVFGPKQIDSLCEFVQSVPSQDACDELGTKCPEDVPFQVSGFVSTIEHGKGRSCADRQFLFVNNRPCDMTKLTRIVNEVYRQYNRHQYPFLALDVRLRKQSVDVNVTPDKRQIFMENENLLLAIVKSSLIKMYEPLSSSYQMQLHSKSSGINCDPLASRTSPKLVPTQTLPINSAFCLTKLKRNFASAFASVGDSAANENKDRNINAPSLDTFDQASKRSCVESDGTKFEAWPTSRRWPSGTSNVQTGLTPHRGVDSTRHVLITSPNGENEPRTQDKCTAAHQYSNPDDRSTCNQSIVTRGPLGATGISRNDSQGGSDITSANDIESSSSLFYTDCPDGLESPRKSGSSECHELLQFTAHSKKGVACQQELNARRHGDEESDHYGDNVKTMKAVSMPTEDCLIFVSEKANYDERVPVSRKRSVRVKFSLTKLREHYTKRRCDDEARRERRFRAAITPGDNRQAEDELRKQVDKQMLAEMEVLGQFNLGFIITRLQNDLFIVDQHASDEKYNFETLQRTTTLDGQPLITPQDLQLSVVNEFLLLENLQVFRKNGFEFLIDDEAPCREKVKLISAPVSRNWLFGKNDIDEMLFMLGESPKLMCRPSRVREMFASRACRKSIMIGTALSHKEMRKLLTHMSEVDQPWNCPHGRPTMRHLINLDMIAG